MRDDHGGTAIPLTRLALRAIHPLPRGARGVRWVGRRNAPLLPLWEKVPEGRMRGVAAPEISMELRSLS